MRRCPTRRRPGLAAVLAHAVRHRRHQVLLLHELGVAGGQRVVEGANDVGGARTAERRHERREARGETALRTDRIAGQERYRSGIGLIELTQGARHETKRPGT